MKRLEFATPPMPDIQSQPDLRGVAIDQAGIRGLRLPARVVDASGRACASVLRLQATVAVPAGVKGTHMSRFVEVLETLTEDFQLARLPEYLERLLDRLQSPTGELDVEFPWFLEKRAPVSGVSSLLDVEARFRVGRGPQGLRLRQGVAVPVTSLCPCSKAISRYGAHNQRSEVRVLAQVERALALDELVATIEAQASCALYGLLKRPDEKYVTERAYENPKFVEDMVRDVFTAVAGLPGVGALTVECENFESIHNHSAFALIERA